MQIWISIFLKRVFICAILSIECLCAEKEQEEVMGCLG